MKKILFTAAVLFSLPAFAAPTVAGKWNVHLSIAGNESDQDCVLAVADNKISGTCKSDDKSSPVNGTISGDKVSWIIESESNGTPLTLTYKVTTQAEGKMAGSVDVAPFGVSGDFTATAAK